MNHADILRSSASKVNELDSSYGPTELVFDRAAKIASILLDTQLSAYYVSMIAVALNLAHIQGNRMDSSNYVSAIVNVAFSGQFAQPDTLADDLKGFEEAATKFRFSVPRAADAEASSAL